MLSLDGEAPAHLQSIVLKREPVSEKQGRVSSLAMFFEARHDFNEIAGTVAVVQLEFQDALPGIPAGAGGTGDTENIGALRDSAASPGLDC